MGAGQQNSLISALARLLTGQTVDPRAVTDGLALICDAYSFTGGLIYDLDQYGYLHLMEYSGLAETAPPCDRFPLDALSGPLQAHLVSHDLCRLVRGAETAPDSAPLLDQLRADALVVAPILEENAHLYGLVALVDTDRRQSRSDAEQAMLSAALSLLVRYVGIRMYQNRISFVQTSLGSILDNTGIDIYVNDFENHDILYVNRSMAAPYGGKEQFTDEKCWKVLFPGQSGPCAFCPQQNLIDENGAPTKVYTWDYQRPFDGSWFRVFSAAFRWVDGRLAHVVSSADITDNKRNEQIIEYMAHYDQLTNLPNRRMLVRDCERHIGGASDKELGYLLFFDIDGFKAINDEFGHDAGDEFLVQLGGFFNSIPLLKDATYRNGGDEFVAILGGEDVTKTHIRNLATFIHRRFEDPWQLKKGAVRCNTSIGVACFPEDGTTAEALLLRADQAMYHSKKQGPGGICFACEMG